MKGLWQNAILSTALFFEVEWFFLCRQNKGRDKQYACPDLYFFVLAYN